MKENKVHPIYVYLLGIIALAATLFILDRVRGYYYEYKAGKALEQLIKTVNTDVRRINNRIPVVQREHGSPWKYSQKQQINKVVQKINKSKNYEIIDLETSYIKWTDK